MIAVMTGDINCLHG